MSKLAKTAVTKTRAKSGLVSEAIPLFFFFFPFASLLLLLFAPSSSSSSTLAQLSYAFQCLPFSSFFSLPQNKSKGEAGFTFRLIVPST